MDKCHVTHVCVSIERNQQAESEKRYPGHQQFGPVGDYYQVTEMFPLRVEIALKKLTSSKKCKQTVRNLWHDIQNNNMQDRNYVENWRLHQKLCRETLHDSIDVWKSLLVKVSDIKMLNKI